MHDPTQRARSLRRNQTETEEAMWAMLRSRRFHGFKFRRQVPLGRYIVDFVCFQQRLILELDGEQHGQRRVQSYDARRTAWLEGEGFRVLRFWNHQLWEEAEAVEELIWETLRAGSDAAPPSPPAPLPRGERGDR